MGGHALDKVLAGCMFGVDAAVRCCPGREGQCDGKCGGHGLWAVVFEGDAAVWRVALLG